MEQHTDDEERIEIPMEVRLDLAIMFLERHYDAGLEDLVDEPLTEGNERAYVAAALDAFQVSMDAVEETGELPETLEEVRRRIDAWRLERDTFAVAMGINLAEQPGGHADMFSIREWAFEELERQDRFRPWRRLRRR